MPTVEEVLRESGFSADQIAALDQRAVGAFTTILSTADQQRQAAEAARQANADFYDNRIMPALTGWDEERARIENERATAAAEAAFYRTQAQEAKNAGFVAAEAPTFTPSQPQQRDQSGRYVSGVPGSTPGSPTYFDVHQVYQRAGDAVGILADIEWEHRRLFNQPLPVSPSELVKRADAVKMDPRSYASREFHWDEKRQELQKAEQDKHDDAIRRETKEKTEREIYERVGSNPDIRRPQDNLKMTTVARAVKSGTAGLSDPLLLNDQQRRAQTSQMIRGELAEAER